MDDSSILNELKSLILSKTGIRTITPADCKRISIEISKTLNKNVSETTIKRLFGFAMAKHNFSKFTLTTLSEYVSTGTIENVPNPNIQNNVPDWKEVHHKSIKITDFTLKGIKNRSGLPYEMTISRKFAEHDFRDFFNSHCTFTSFISQPGYGRTILLSHLAQRFLSNEQIAYKGSTLLFITAYHFFNKDQISLNFEDQLKAHLGIHQRESLIKLANQNYNLTGGKFIILLDGFSEIVLKKDFKKQIFENIINFLCSIEDSNSIKLVMSMRSTTWIGFYDTIRHSAFLRTKWFTGNYFNQNDLSNVPPLTEKEIDLILSKINQCSEQEINPKLKTQLKFPFHIQLYYQLKEEDPHFNYSTNITFYELISRFIQHKIYRSNYYTEKILFLKKIIQLTNYGNKGNSVLKDNLISELSAFKNAYMELLSDGILMEEKSHEEFHPKEFVRFIHPHIFEYFLFIELLEKFHLRVDHTFFAYIKQEYKNNQAKFQLLQWTVRFIIRIGDFKALNGLFDLNLNHYERNYLILFIAENLDYRAKYSPETIKLIKNHGLHEVLIKELIHFDFVDSCYKEAIITLMKVVDNDENLLIYHTLLLAFDIISLNPERIHNRMMVLSKFKTDKWLADPYQIAKLIYSRALNIPVDGETFTNTVETSVLTQKINTNEVSPQLAISYLMILLLNSVYNNNPEKILDTITMIANKHQKIFSKRTTFPIFILTIYGLISSVINPGKKTNQWERILINLGNNKSRFKITNYVEFNIKLMQAYQLKNRHEYLMAYQYCLECLPVFKRNDLNIICLMIYNLIIEIFILLKDDAKVNEYKYEKLCFIEDNNISAKVIELCNDAKRF